MVAVYGNLMVMGITVALFVATINLGKRRDAQSAENTRTPAVVPAANPPR
ncbi:MAG: hypothetical protein ABI333_11165 [bacterium]